METLAVISLAKVQGVVREGSGAHKHLLLGIPSLIGTDLTAHVHGDQAHLPFSLHTCPHLHSLLLLAFLGWLPGIVPSLQKYLLDSAVLESIVQES